MYKGTFWGENFWLQELFFMLTPSAVCFFAVLLKLFTREWQKCLSVSIESTWGWKILWKKNLFCFSNIQRCLQEFLSMAVKTAFYLSIETFCGEWFLLDENVFFWYTSIFERKVLAFVQFLSADFSKLYSTCQLERYEYKTFFGKIQGIFCHFTRLSVFFFFLSNFFTRWCENGTVRVRRKCLRKIYFLE